MQVDSGSDSETSLDFDLNLAPIIDCFTVLITFLLISAGYVSIHIIEASVASTEEVSAASVPAANGVSLTLLVKLGGGVDIVETGEENQTFSLPASPTLDAATAQKLSELRDKWKDLKILTVAGEENVEYKDIVRTMEAARPFFPTILLGGF